MDHSQIMGMITSPSSWEQVIYDVLAFEGLDPWDIDLTKLAQGFVRHIDGLKEMDFKIPAKYVMVAATLLRMKSDHIPLLQFLQEPEAEEIEVAVPGEITGITEQTVLSPLTIPPLRMHKRRIIVGELIDALRKALGTADKRVIRLEDAKNKIKIREEDLGKRISSLYDRINSILSKLKKNEVGFSTIVPQWNKPDVADTFLPLVYLDHQKKIECRQEQIFDEIYVRRGAAPEKAKQPIKEQNIKKGKTKGKK